MEIRLTGRGKSRIRRAKEKAVAQGNAPELWENKKGRAARVVAFLEALPITKGKLVGTNMKLLPNQRKFIERIYGPKSKVRLAVKSEPRGNGKTGLLAGLALCHLLGPEAEQRGEIYSAAIDRQQAGLMYNEMEAIIVAVPRYSARCNLQRFHKKIEVIEGRGEGSVYEALSSDARRAHGLSPTLWVYDELAQAKDRVLLDNLMTAMGKRNRSLGIIISTQAPKDDHPLSQLIDHGETGTDETLIVDRITAPDDADAFSLKTIAACNRALGIFLDKTDVMKAAKLASRIAAFEPAHRNLRLNQRVDSSEDSRIVTKEIWAKGNVAVDPKKFEGCDCYGGLDLSGKHDLSALELGFPDKKGGFDILSFFWTPEGQLDARRPAERDLFKLWIKQGWLIGVPGPTIKFEWVAMQLAQLSQKFNIKAVGYDRWRIDDFKLELDEYGCTVPLEPFGQGFKDMAPAVELFAEKALNGLLRHGGNPVLTQSVANAILVSDPAGNQKFDKEKSNGSASIRIDGAVALTMMIGTASKFEAKREPPRTFDMMWI